MIITLELNLNTICLLAMLLLFGSMICDGTSGSIPVPSPSPVHGESPERLSASASVVPVSYHSLTTSTVGRDSLVETR